MKTIFTPLTQNGNFNPGFISNFHLPNLPIEKRFFVPEKSEFKKSKEPIQLPARNQRILESFKKYLLDNKYKSGSVETYCYVVSHFMAHYEKFDIRRISNEKVLEFLNQHLPEKNYSISYQNQAYSTLKAFLKYMGKCIRFIELRNRPKSPKKEKQPGNKNQILKMIFNIANLKHRFVLALFYETAIRKNEFLSLKVEDLNLGSRYLRIKAKRGKEERLIPLSDTFMVLARNYLEKYTPGIFLVEGISRGPYSPEAIWTLWKDALKSNELPHNTSLNFIRQSRIKHWLDEGVPRSFIREWIGTDSLRGWGRE